MEQFQLSDIECGVCGNPSDVMYCYGYRCREHENVGRESLIKNSSIELVVTFGRVRETVVNKLKRDHPEVYERLFGNVAQKVLSGLRKD